jgi:hypothetical protein
LIVILALCEGHQNNHPANTGLARQGLFWWEFDPTYYMLKVLSWVGLVKNLNEPIPEVYETARMLERMRKKMSGLKLAKEIVTERLREGQRLIAPLVTRMAHLRNKARKMMKESGLVTREIADSIREGGVRFREMLRQAEDLAMA